MAKLTIPQIRRMSREDLERHIGFKLRPCNVEFLSVENDQDGDMIVHNKIKRPGAGYGVWTTIYTPASSCDGWVLLDLWQED